MKQQQWLVILGGVVAIVGQWVPEYYLPLIGGALTLIGALLVKK